MYPGPTSSCSIHNIGSTVGRLALAWSKVPTKWWFKHVSRGLGCDFRSCPRQTPCWLCAPPSATIAGTKPGRPGKPICVPNELCSNTSTPSHAFWPWHLLLPGLLFGSDPLRLRLPSFQCFLLRLPLCFPEPHALPLIIPGNEPSFPVQRGLQKSDGHPHQAGERQFFAQMRTTAEPLLRCQLLLPTAIEAG
jgi:hypothetical protein